MRESEGHLSPSTALALIASPASPRERESRELHCARLMQVADVLCRETQLSQYLVGMLP